MNGFSLRHDVGTGDLFNVEGYWSPAKKASLEVIHHAFYHSPGSAALIETMEACPSFKHVRHRQMAYPTEPIPGAHSTLRDHAIGHLLTFHGSAFISDTLDVEVPRGLPERFDYLLPSTPKNGPHCTRWVRDEEWPHILARLEERDTIGLVVNSPGGNSVIPDHPRILDWTGRTSMPQSIEILKRAAGYIGVDSACAILAAQLFGPADLWIRTNNAFVVGCPWLHYQPQADFSFLFPAFGQPHHPVAPPMEPIPGGVVVELRCNALVGVRNFTTGDRVEVLPARADAMLECGQAVPVESLE